MDTESKTRLTKAMELVEEKRLKAEQKRLNAEQQERERKERQAGAADAWPKFREMVSQAATILNNTTANQNILLGVSDGMPSNTYLKSLSVSISIDQKETTSRVLFHLSKDGSVETAVLLPHTGKGGRLNIFTSTDADIERALVNFLEQYAGAMK